MKCRFFKILFLQKVLAAQFDLNYIALEGNIACLVKLHISENK